MAEAELIQLRHGTAAQWTSANPVLAAGEVGAETDTHQGKVGDGSTAWNDLPYFSGSTTTVASAITALQAATELLKMEPVTVQTANYSATPGQFVPVDATSAAVSVSLPSMPADGSIITVKKIDSSAHAVTVLCSGSDVFDKASGSTSLTLALQYQVVNLQYYQATRIWYVLSTDPPLAGLDARYLTSPTITNPTLSGPTLSGTVVGTYALAGTPTIDWANVIPLAALATAAYSTNPTANILAAWDGNKNLSANAIYEAFNSTPTSGGTLTLSVTSAQIQYLTGTQSHTVVLASTSLPAGAGTTIINGSTGAITVQASAGGTVYILAPGTMGTFISLAAAPTLTTQWQVRYVGMAVANGKLLTVNNSLTLAGTDGTTMTFPGTSDTVVTLAASQSLTNKNLAGSGMTWPTNLAAFNAKTAPTGAVVGTSDTQTLSGKTLTSPVINSPTFGGTGVPNAAIQQAGINNFNTSAYGPTQLTAATPVYVPGSNLLTPATPLNGIVAGTTFIWDIAMNKNAAGTGAFSVLIYRGLNGNTTDTADVNQAISSAQTAVVDQMTLEIQLTVITNGATGSYYWSVVPTHLAASAAGFGVAIGATGQFTGQVTNVALNTPSLIFGIGIVAAAGGTMQTLTIPQVASFAYNLN